MNALESISKALEWVNDILLNPWILIPGLAIFAVFFFFGLRHVGHLLFDYNRDPVIWKDPISRFLLLFSNEPKKPLKKKATSERVEDLITYPDGYGEADSYEEHLRSLHRHPRSRK